MALELIPNAEALAALRMVAGQLRWENLTTYLPSETADRRDLVADVLVDLACNIEAGVSELRRSDAGSVFLFTAAIEPVS